jgi:hypothetical protein
MGMHQILKLYMLPQAFFRAGYPGQKQFSQRYTLTHGTAEQKYKSHKMSSLASNYRKSKNAQIDHKTSNLIVYMVLCKTSVN